MDDGQIQDQGASADADRAGGPADLSPASGSQPKALIPSAQVPSLWPLGSGCVMTTHVASNEMALFLFRAVSDDLVGKAGEPAGWDAWEACAGAPTLALSFADAAAVRRLIDGLALLAQAMSAREGHDRNGHGAKPASAVGNADAPDTTPSIEGEA
jgi:hypothetical protein